MTDVIGIIAAAIIGGILAIASQWLINSWKLQREIRQQRLDHYQTLVAVGNLLINPWGIGKLPPGQSQEDRIEEIAKDLNDAIFLSLFFASPVVLHRIEQFNRAWMQWQKDISVWEQGQPYMDERGVPKLDAKEEPSKDAMRRTYMDMFLAMRADLGMSNHCGLHLGLFCRPRSRFRGHVDYLLRVQPEQALDPAF